MTPQSTEKLYTNRSPAIMFVIRSPLFSCCFSLFIHKHTHAHVHRHAHTHAHTHVLTSSSLIPIPRCRAHARQTDSRQTAMLAACSFVYKHTAIAMINFRIVITITAAKSLCQASRMPTKLMTIELCTASGTEPHW